MVIWKRGHSLESHFTDCRSQGLNSGDFWVQGKWFIHYTKATLVSYQTTFTKYYIIMAGFNRDLIALRLKTLSVGAQ